MNSPAREDDQPTVEPVAVRLDHTGQITAIGHPITGHPAERMDPPRWRDMHHPEDSE